MAITAIDLVEKDFLKIEKDSSISQLIGKMISSKRDSALVFQEGSFLGIVSRRELAKKNIADPSKIKVSSVLESVPVLQANVPIEKIVDLFSASNARILPVFKENSFLGIVSDLKTLKELSDSPNMRRASVKELMKKDFFVLPETATVAQAMPLLRKSDLRIIPIVDKDSCLAGVVSLTDIVEKFFLFPKERRRGRKFIGKASAGFSPEKESIAKTPVINEMTESPVIVSPEEKISKAIKLMFSKNVHNLIVEEGGKAIGIISPKEIFSSVKNTSQPRKNIQIANLPEVDEIDKARIISSIESSYDKICRMVSGELLLRVHFKSQKKSGARAKHLVQIKLSFPGKTISAKAFEWNLLTALQNAIKSLERETTNSIKRKQ